MFFWVFPRRQYVICRRFGTMYQFQFRNVGKLHIDAGEIPKRTYTIIKSRRKLEIYKDKIVPNTDNFMILAILHFCNFILVVDTAVQNTDNEISLHFKPMRLIFMNYSV
jgi:hypothetical protein